MLRYSVETYRAVAEEIKPLLEQHWLEVGRDRELVPLDVNDVAYQRLEDLGMLAIVTARQEGRLVGYVAAIINTHLHYASTKFGTLDVFWLAPDVRKSVNGVGLFTAIEEELKRRGVVKMIGQTKLGPHDVGLIFEFLGWTETERLFTKAVS